MTTYVIGEEADLAARRELVAARREPSLEQFIPRRGDGLALSASDIDLYRTCPLKYKFARVFAIPQEPTINQRFGILIHQVLERFHTEALHADALGAPGRARRRGRAPPGASTAFWPCSRRAGGGPDSAPRTTSFSTATGRWRHWPATTSVELHAGRRPKWLERSFSFSIGPHQLRGRVDRVDRHAGRRLRADRLQDGRAPGDARRGRAARPLPPRRAGGVADRRRARQLLVRAGGRAGADGPGGR